ncbi:hypothetical protein K3495_g14956, partial [Podosphaera aphanis]
MPDFGTIRRTALIYDFSSEESSPGEETRPGSAQLLESDVTEKSSQLENAFRNFHLTDTQLMQPINKDNDKMAAQMPTLPNFTMTPFDGTGAGARFLMTLSIKLQGVDTQAWPGLWIQAIYIQVTGAAAVWMDTTPHIAALVQSLRTVTVAQREAFDREFTEQFPGTWVDPTQPPTHLELSTFRQRSDETLQQYQTRARELWRRIVEAPNVAGVKGIASSIAYQVFVSGFVNGIYDELLRVQAISQGAMSAPTIPEAIEIINRAYQTTASLILYSQRAEIPAWNAIQNHTPAQGSVNAASQAHQGHNLGVCFPNPSIPANLLYPLGVGFQARPNGHGNAVANYPRSIPSQLPPAQQALPAPSRPQDTPALQPYPQQQSHRSPQPNGYAGPSQPPQNTDRRPMPHKYVNPRFNPMTSRVPVVNGSERMARHCTSCGRDEGHSYRACPNPRLSEDESNTLYNIIAARHNQRFFGTEFPEVRSVQFAPQQPQNYEAERTYGPPRPDSPYPQEAVANREEEYADWPTVRLGSLPGGSHGQSGSGSRAINFCSCPSESGADKNVVTSA